MKEYSICVDLRNPGQFFACCGILYCADRMFENAMGCFKEDRFTIKAQCDGNPIHEIIKKLNEVDPECAIRSDTNDANSPLYIDSIPIRFDFYNHIDNRYKIKLFAGQETFTKIISRWMNHLKDYKEKDVIDLHEFTKTDVPSGIDVATSWNALDVGFSLNEQRIKKRMSYPLVEFFAHVGVQTYSWSKNRSKYTYRTWSDFLPITVARAVASGIIKLEHTRYFQFNTEKSGQKQVLNIAREVDEVS